MEEVELPATGTMVLFVELPALTVAFETMSLLRLAEILLAMFGILSFPEAFGSEIDWLYVVTLKSCADAFSAGEVAFEDCDIVSESLVLLLDDTLSVTPASVPFVELFSLNASDVLDAFAALALITLFAWTAVSHAWRANEDVNDHGCSEFTRSSLELPTVKRR